MFYQKAAVWGRWCLNLVFSDSMHQRASHPIGMRAKPCATWLSGGKTLELPDAKYLCIKKMGKLKFLCIDYRLLFVYT